MFPIRRKLYKHLIKKVQKNNESWNPKQPVVLKCPAYAKRCFGWQRSRESNRSSGSGGGSCGRLWGCGENTLATTDVGWQKACGSTVPLIETRAAHRAVTLHILAKASKILWCTPTVGFDVLAGSNTARCQRRISSSWKCSSPALLVCVYNNGTDVAIELTISTLWMSLSVLDGLPSVLEQQGRRNCK